MWFPLAVLGLLNLGGAIWEEWWFFTLGPALAYLAVAAWYRTRRWQKVGVADLVGTLLAPLVFFALGSLQTIYEQVPDVLLSEVTAAALIGVALVLAAPRQAWIPLAAAALTTLALGVDANVDNLPVEPLRDTDLSVIHIYTGGSTPTLYPDANQYLYSRVYASELAVAVKPESGPGFSIAALVLAAGLLGWAARRRNILVALVAVGYGALSFFADGLIAPSVVLVAALALAAYPRGASYPLFAGGVVTLAAVLLGPASELDRGSLHLDPLWPWLLTILVGCGLAGWATLRRNWPTALISSVALVVSMAALPDPRLLYSVGPAAVLIAGAVWLYRRRA